MKINFNTPVLDFNGMPLTEGKTQITFKDHAISALLSGYQDEVLVYEAKIARAVLATKIKANINNPIDITFAEACLVMELVSRITTQPLFTWRFSELFDKAASGQVVEPTEELNVPPRLNVVADNP